MLCIDSDRLVVNEWRLRLRKVLLQKPGMEQSKADLFVFRKVVDGEVTHIVCVQVNLAVTAKNKQTFDAFYAHLKD